MAQDDEDLSDRDLSGADLSGSNFAGQDLSGADLRDANLRGANLASADLREADLRDAILSGANLSGTNLVGADLAGAALAGANLNAAVLEPGDEADGDTSLESLVQTLVSGAIISLGVFLFVADWPWFWVVFLVGFVAVLPAATELAQRYESRADSIEESDVTEKETDATESDRQAALATLRDRYASGEIGEDEFERRVERLLETESVEDAESAYGESSAEDAERERETE